MKSIVINTLWFIVFITSCNSQSVDSVNINKAETMVAKYFPSKLNNMDYIIYNLRDKFLVIIKDTSCYTLSFVSMKEGIEESNTYEYQNKLFNRLFEAYIEIEKKSVLSKEEYLNDCAESYIYFSTHIKGHKKFEFNLPSILLCSDKKISYPIENDLNSFLFDLLLSHWYKK